MRESSFTNHPNVFTAGQRFSTDHGIPASSCITTPNLDGQTRTTNSRGITSSLRSGMPRYQRKGNTNHWKWLEHRCASRIVRINGAAPEKVSNGVAPGRKATGLTLINENIPSTRNPSSGMMNCRRTSTRERDSTIVVWHCWTSHEYRRVSTDQNNRLNSAALHSSI